MVITVMLVIGSPAIMVNAKKHRHLTDTEKEDGTATDKVGRSCNEGSNHDQCHDQSLEEQGVLPAGKGKHLGECEERGDNNVLACDLCDDHPSDSRPETNCRDN